MFDIYIYIFSFTFLCILRLSFLFELFFVELKEIFFWSIVIHFWFDLNLSFQHLFELMNQMRYVFSVMLCWLLILISLQFNISLFNFNSCKISEQLVSPFRIFHWIDYKIWQMMGRFFFKFLKLDGSLIVSFSLYAHKWRSTCAWALLLKLRIIMQAHVPPFLRPKIVELFESCLN